MESRSESLRRRKKKQKCTVCSCWRRNGFLLLLVVSTIGGYALGLSLQSWSLSSQALYLIGFPGQLMLRAFLMIIAPLLFCSLVLAVSSLRKGGDARMVVLTIGLFLLLSTLSAIMGAAAGHLLHPGQTIQTATATQPDGPSGRKGFLLDSMLDLVWNAVPSNIVESTFTKEYTHVEVVNSSLDDGNFSLTYKRSVKQNKGVNFMGILTFSILFGSALAFLGERGARLHEVIEQLNNVIMIILGYILYILPVAMFFWMFREGLESRSQATTELLGHVGLFLATALGCIALHQLLLLPLLYVLLVRRSPVRYHMNLLPAMLTAFGTASSAATLPVTVRCAEQLNRVNRCVSRFVLPLGMVVHMNGGTFYTPLCALFLAQLQGIEVGTVQTIVMCITSILLFISVPATPTAGNPVYLLTVLAAAGIDRPHFISVILSLEWIMERFRTVMNVVADSYVAAIVEKLCRGRLPREDTAHCYPSAVIRGYDVGAIATAPRPPSTIPEEGPPPLQIRV